MSKVVISKETDCHGRFFYKLAKSKGKINMREAYEAMEREYLFGPFLIDFKVTEVVPFDLYEEGDEWNVYNPEELLGDRAEEMFSNGYNACMKDYKL